MLSFGVRPLVTAELATVAVREVFRAEFVRRDSLFGKDGDHSVTPVFGSGWGIAGSWSQFSQ